VFPHHEAEIAQSEAATGHRVVSIWMHGGLLMLSGTRMAKSAGNFFRVTELVEQGIDPLAFRYLALQARYRAPLNFSTNGLKGADRALRQLREKVGEWSRARGSVDAAWDARFREAIADDLDFPRAMAMVAELTRSQLNPGAKAATLIAWDRVLGLDLDRTEGRVLPDGAQELIAEREKARAARDFARADQLREELRSLGVSVADKPVEK
ncbi:MAG TPA: cysteine--tRNA ligase, partial [Candidatus Dormibacteraeota bacterium]|nr:cysteine--tRNA ligase [Candidatus Dormibacteraeota bacterium]